MSLFGYLAILAGVAKLVLAVFFFTFVKRLLGRESSPLSEEIGGFRKVLRKLREGEPMSEDELDFARQIIADRGSLLAYSIPAAIFALGCFYVFGNLELHGTSSLRPYIGLGPLIGSINVTVRLLRIASLKGRLRSRTPLDTRGQAVAAWIADR